MKDGFYILMCNYAKPGFEKILNYECLLDFKPNEIAKYSLGDNSYKSTRQYYLLPLLPEQIVTRPETDDKIKSLLCENFPHLNARSEYEFLYFKTFLDSGEYHPNIYRPFLCYDFIEKQRNLPDRNDLAHILFEDIHLFDEKEYLSRLNQLEILVEELQTIFQVVEPTINNYKTFGHKIRNLIILACTEVDSICKNILLSNSYKKKERYSMNDYIRLKGVLKLNQYKIDLIRYPEILNISPFIHWEEKEPTKSLCWYNSYNAIKHDRINNAHLATLENAINAVCAVVILLLSQYGSNNDYWKNKMQHFFYISQNPDWQYSDLYIPPVWGKDLIEIKYEF